MNSLRDGVRRLSGALPPWALAAAAVAVVLVIPFTSPPRLVQLTIIFGVNALLAQSINVLTGYAGQISLGQAAIYGTGAYGASKAGVISLTHSMNRELEGDGIRICAICPGFVDTPMAQWTGMSTDEMIQPEDCAEIVRLLLRLSPAARIPQVVVERLGDRP